MKKKRHLRPSIRRMLDGFEYGIALGIGLIIPLLFFLAAWQYTVYR